MKRREKILDSVYNGVMVIFLLAMAGGGICMTKFSIDTLFGAFKEV